MAQSQAVLPWDTCRCLVGKVGNKEISVQGHRMFADEIVEEETAAHLLQGLAKPKRRFNVAALAARMRGERIGAVAPPVVQPAQSQAASGPQQEPGELLPVEAPGSSRRWVMVRWLGAPRVHLLQDGSGTPLCRMRQGDAGRPIVRLAGASTGLGGLNHMGWGGCRLRSMRPCSASRGEELPPLGLFAWRHALDAPGLAARAARFAEKG